MSMNIAAMRCMKRGVSMAYDAFQADAAPGSRSTASEAYKDVRRVRSAADDAAMRCMKRGVI
jgi:hypothetical protein